MLANVRLVLASAVAIVTGNRPALSDRGEIAVGKRADLVMLREIERLSVITGELSAGRMIR